MAKGSLSETRVLSAERFHGGPLPTGFLFPAAVKVLPRVLKESVTLLVHAFPDQPFEANEAQKTVGIGFGRQTAKKWTADNSRLARRGVSGLPGRDQLRGVLQVKQALRSAE